MTSVWPFLTCRPAQEQEEERPDVPADRGGSETEASSVESSFQAVLRSKNRSPAGEPAALRRRCSRHELSAERLHGKKEEVSDFWVARFSAAAERGVEQVLRAQNGFPPVGQRGVWARDGGPEPIWSSAGTEQWRAPR